MRGKWLRAEPVAALYEQGRVAHVGALPELEDEMSDFGPDGLSGGASPDRVDALVWALTDLMLRGRPSPASGGCERRFAPTPPFVMPGLVPGDPACDSRRPYQSRLDGRDKPGHDDMQLRMSHGNDIARATGEAPRASKARRAGRRS